MDLLILFALIVLNLQVSRGLRRRAAEEDRAAEERLLKNG